MVAELGAEGFEFVEGVEVEQGFVYVDKLVGKIMRAGVKCRQIIIATKARGNRHYPFSVVESRQVVARRVGDNINDFVNHGVEFGTMYVFV